MSILVFTDWPPFTPIVSASLKPTFLLLSLKKEGEVEINLCCYQNYSTNAVMVTSTISSISIGKYILYFSVQLSMLFNLVPRFVMG